MLAAALSSYKIFYEPPSIEGHFETLKRNIRHAATASMVL